MSTIDPDTISFAASKRAPEYFANVSAEVVALAGNPDVGIMFAEGNPLWISGDTGSGKTTSMLHLMKSRLTGEDWLERFPVKKAQSKLGFINLDRASTDTLMRSMNFHLFDQLIMLNGLELKGLNFNNDPLLLNRISQHTGVMEFYIDGMSQLVNNPADTVDGQAFAVAVANATNAGINVVGTFQNKKDRWVSTKKGETTTGNVAIGKGAVLGSVHILGSCGVCIVLKEVKGNVHATKFEQVKGCDGRDLIGGEISHNHQAHTSGFAGGNVLGALKVRGTATLQELAADCAIKTTTTVEKHLLKQPELWRKETPTKRQPSGAPYPFLFHWMGLNSDSIQLDEGTNFNGSSELNPVKETAFISKGVT